MITLVLPVLFMYAQNGKERPDSKIHKKEIPASRLPKTVTRYISENLPNARITKVTKQKKNPDATYMVAIDIKTKHHILVFNKGVELFGLTKGN